MTGLTRELGQFVAALDGAAIPASARNAVRRGIADCIGVMLAGRSHPVVELAAATVTVQPQGAASVLVDRGRASAPDAAFVNAAAAHVLDYDDTGLDGHPSVVLASVVLAEAERLGAQWSDCITAYVVGYETWAELIGRDLDKHHGKGWHPTAVFGAVAAAAAAAWFRRLSPEQAAHALGIAASMSAGVVANFGSMTKPLQVGWAVRNGMNAAALAERGVTASPDALESPRGLLAALSPGGRVRLDGPCQAGRPWQIECQGLNIKRYPVCYALHRAVDAATALHPALRGRTTDVERVIVHLGRLQVAMLRSSRPNNGLDARFSAEYAIACMLLRGQVKLADLEDGLVNEPAVQALLRKVSVQVDDSADEIEPLFSPADQVEVVLRDGTRLASERVARALGHATRPIDVAALRAKFDDCASRSVDAALAARLWTRVMHTGDEERVTW
jgi:2-methylcitrate dehydratase PrpD